MSLYEIKTGKCIYERGSNGPIFHDPILKDSLEDGIVIPKYAQNLFHGRSIVELEDPEFDQALKYYATTILNKHTRKYEWRD